MCEHCSNQVSYLEYKTLSKDRRYLEDDVYIIEKSCLTSDDEVLNSTDSLYLVRNSKYND
jgi:DNA-dependent RNA polymerase auxiliary subunit epsilon